MKRLDCTITVDATSSNASETIDTLETEKENGHLSGYTVEYRDSKGILNLHIWYDMPDGANPQEYYDDVNTALSKLPVSIPVTAETSPIISTDND